MNSRIDAAFVYGVTIHLPEDPSWKVLCWRLEQVANPSRVPTLFATAARAVSDPDLETAPESVAKYARVIRSVVISENDVTQEEME